MALPIFFPDDRTREMTVKTFPLALLSLVAAACVSNPVKRDPPPMPFVGTKWMLVTERKVE